MSLRGFTCSRSVATCLKAPIFRVNRATISTLRTYASVAPLSAAQAPIRFPEENLASNAEQGYGYIHVRVNDILGERYKIERKLGWGRFSSVYLAQDLNSSELVSVKVLTAAASHRARRENTKLRAIDDVAILEAVSKPSEHPGRNHCATAQHVFDTQSVHGSHTCIVGDELSGSVARLQHTCEDGVLPLETMKKVVVDTFRALDYLHTECRVAHCDLNKSNILLDVRVKDTPSFDKFAATVPTPTLEYHGTIIPVVINKGVYTPDPITAHEFNYKLVDFGSAQFLDQPLLKPLTPVTMRPSETIFRPTAWDEKVDIWSMGCLIFEMITGGPLFRVDPTLSNADAELDVAAQHLGLPGEHYSEEVLERSRDKRDPQGRLINEAAAPEMPRIFDLLNTYATASGMSKSDVKGASDLIVTCLQVDATMRPSAKELAATHWLQPSV